MSQSTDYVYVVELYHAHRRQAMEDLPFWLSLAHQTGGPVLDLGSGSGVVSDALVKAGFKVDGLDRNFEMLTFLKKTSPQETQGKFNVIQGDMTSFHLAKAYGLIILACNTLSTLPMKDMQRTFSLVYRHLRPGGLFAADLPNPSILRELPSEGEIEFETSFDHPITGYPVQVYSAWQRRGNEAVISWHYDHLFPNGRVERTTQRTKHFIYELKEYLDGLECAKLQVVSLYGDFQRNEYYPDSAQLILVARRPR